MLSSVVASLNNYYASMTYGKLVVMGRLVIMQEGPVLSGRVNSGSLLGILHERGGKTNYSHTDQNVYLEELI